jgi:CHAP domain
MRKAVGATRVRRWATTAVSFALVLSYSAPQSVATAEPLPHAPGSGVVAEATPNSIILASDTVVTVSKVSTEALCTGDFGLETPDHELLFHDYLAVAPGASADVGSYSTGTELVFFFAPQANDGICGGSFLSTDPTRAQVTADATGWTIGWEDSNLTDFNDLVVHVTVSTSSPPGVVVPGTAWFHGSGVDVCRQADAGPKLTTCGHDDPIGTATLDNPWQCVELAQRFFKHVGDWANSASTSDGVFTYPNGTAVGYAFELRDWALAHPESIEWHPKAETYLPVPGDLVVTGSNGIPGSLGYPGHVAVVDFVDVENGETTINVVEQNNSSTGRAKYVYPALSRTGEDREVLGTVHAKANAPTAHLDPLPTFRASRSIPLNWGATPGSGAITGYIVRVRRAKWSGTFSGYTNWQSTTLATNGSYTGAAGYTYCFGVKALDELGSASAWTGDRCTATPLDDRSLARTGSWAASMATGYYDGTYLRSSTEGAKLTRSDVVARQIAVLVRTCPGCGTIKVYWGSTLLKTISLNATTTTRSHLIAVKTFSAVHTGTLTIKVSSAHKSVTIDGIVIRRN